MSEDTGSTHPEDQHLRRHLGFWQLTAIAVSGVIGSGWLLSAMFAAQAAGPAAIITWAVGGAALLLIALVMVELGATRPQSGGLVRWPQATSGSLAATIVGCGIWIAYATNPPSESAAMLQYMAKYVPGLYHGTRLTVAGVGAGIVLMAIFVAVNWFGVQVFARVNGVITAAKVIVPAISVITLLVAALTSGHSATANYTAHGFAPYGFSASLSAIATAGIIYAYTGFQGPLDLSGEARDPRRDVPRAVIVGLLVSMVLYLALQAVFIAVLPRSFLAHGWAGVNLTSPFAQLAMALNLSWLSWLLYADAIVSPGGSALTFTATISREAYGMAKNRIIPAAIARIDLRSGVPRRALILNFVIGVVFLLLLPSWHSIVAATSELGLFAYSMTAISQQAFRRADPGGQAGWIRGTTVIAPVSFVIATLILYWATWTELRIALPLLLIAIVIYAVNMRTAARRAASLRADVRAGAWLVVYLAAVLLMSAIGSRNFGGLGLIPAPWDSVVVAAIGVAAYFRGVRDASAYLALTRPTGRTGRTDSRTASGEPEPSQSEDLRSGGQ
jgi:amino acid transporter